MAFDYKAPGVTINEETESSAPPLIATSDAICLIGPASGVLEGTATLTLSGTAPSRIIDGVDATIPASGALEVLDLYPASSTSDYNTTAGYFAKGGGFGGYVFKQGSQSVTSLTVTTSADSTSATLSGVGGLTANTTYFISSTTIPASSNITFTTANPPTTSITLSNSTGVTAGSGRAAVITNPPTIERAITSVVAKTVTSTAGSTTIVFNSNGGLETNTIYLISSAGIPASSKITFTTPNSLPPNFTYTLSSSNGVSEATSAAAIITKVGVAGLTVDTTAGSRTATLSGTTGLVANTIYSISAGTAIPENKKVYFKTADPIVAQVTLSEPAAATATAATAVIRQPVIPDGAQVQVKYQYTPNDYWTPKVYTSADAVQQAFGNKYTTDQTAIQSPLSLAAQLAFDNGATEIVVQPVFKKIGNVITAPTNEEIKTVDNTWVPSLESLQTVENVGVIVPVIGQSSAYNAASGAAKEFTDDNQLSVFAAVQDHINTQQKNSDQYLIGIFGEDRSGPAGNSTYASRDKIINHAEVLRANHAGQHSQQIVVVSPASFSRTTPNGNVLGIGGQYVAAAIAGMLVSREVSSSLTRKNIIGFSGLNESRTKLEKTGESKKGILVVEAKGNNIIQIRHSITIDITDVAKSELSVVRAKHKLIQSLRKTVDEQIVGQIVADNSAPIVVAQTIAGVLTNMQDNGEIVQFANIEAKTKSLNPTVIEIRFSYLPAFPVNYIQIDFSIDLSTGTLNLSNTNVGGING